MSAVLQLRRRNERHPDVLIFGEVETLGHDADDGGGLRIYAHHAANHVSRAIPFFPHAGADEHDGSGAWLVIGREKISPSYRPDMEHAEEARRDAVHVVTMGRYTLFADDGS